ncbi:nucleotide-sugar uncharacterized transporter 3 [Carica papaya]|uniref:nucleotide-sugar uncharacterized transporter 3 n=1 Tax=Carica papaya TaxID=3649 RepID=UPI000B8C73B4|nr:nucleotide-sugar uncharacterized transporter 3 [Carica papaya]
MSLSSSNLFKGPVLPVSDTPRDEEKERLIKGDEKLFRGSLYWIYTCINFGFILLASQFECIGKYFAKRRCDLSHKVLNYIDFLPLQMICSCSFLYILRRWKIISFTASESVVTSDNTAAFVPLETLVHTLPLAVAYLLYMLASMESVRGVNVPMYTTLRRTTVAFTMVMEYMLTGQRYTSSIVGSVGLIVLGAFIAGARDFSFDFYGYAFVFLANVATAVYLAAIARIGKSSGLNSFGLMWCNGIICGPILLLWTLLHGDFVKTIYFPHILSPGFLIVLLLSCILAFFLNYSVFLNTTLNSALTQTICGNLKDLFTIGFGWILFGGLPFDVLNVIGQLIGFLGSGVYAYCKVMGY